MKLVIVLATALLAWSQLVVADEAAGDADAGAEKAKTCAACHNTMVSLRERGADVITEQIKAIQAGDKDYPPGLAELSEEDLADIAAYLDAAD